MSESLVSLIVNQYATYTAHNLSACDLLIHAQDFIRYIIKYNKLDEEGYDYLSIQFRVNEVICNLKACNIRPLFVVDGSPVSSEKILGVPTWIICEILSSVGATFAVSRSNAVSTCLALIDKNNVPFLISNAKFYVSLFSKNPQSGYILLPIDCLQNLHPGSTVLAGKNISFTKLSFPPGYICLASLLIDLAGIPIDANRELSSVIKALLEHKENPLPILQYLMRSALSFDDPCLLTQKMIDYLIALTPDFDEASKLSSRLGLRVEAPLNNSEYFELDPHSPQYFLNFVLHLIEGKPCHHSKVVLDNPDLIELFYQGKIDTSFLSSSTLKASPPIRVLQYFQQEVLSKRITVHHSWSLIVEVFHFPVAYLMDEGIAAILLSCLLWHPHSSCSDHPPELCPIILSTVFCSLVSLVCEGCTEVFSTMLDCVKEFEELDHFDVDKTYLKQACDILHIYSEILTLCNIVGYFNPPRFSLMKQVSLHPTFRVFPSLRLCALLAAKLKCSRPEDCLFSPPIASALSSDASILSSTFNQFIDLIKNTKIYWDESNPLPESFKSDDSDGFTSMTSGWNRKAVISKSANPGHFNSVINDPTRISVTNKSVNSGYSTPATTTAEGSGTKELDGGDPSSSWRRRPLAISTADSCDSGHPAWTPDVIDFDRPKTPPPASALMKKSKGKSKYAARLAERFGNKI